MSQKIDATGNPLGAYEREDLETFWFPEEYKKGRRRLRLRILHYDLVWDITEMQVKVHVRAVFPNPTGALTTQLAKERPFEAHETIYTGESRSRALERDIEISRAAISKPGEDAETPREEDEMQEGLTDHLDLAGQHHHQQQGTIEVPQTTSSARIILRLGPRNMNSPVRVSRPHAAQQ